MKVEVKEIPKVDFLIVALTVHRALNWLLAFVIKRQKCVACIVSFHIYKMYNIKKNVLKIFAVVILEKAKSYVSISEIP